MYSHSFPGFRTAEQVGIQQPGSWDLEVWKMLSLLFSYFSYSMIHLCKTLLSSSHPLHPPSVRQPAACVTPFSLLRWLWVDCSLEFFTWLSTLFHSHSAHIPRFSGLSCNGPLLSSSPYIGCDLAGHLLPVLCHTPRPLILITLGWVSLLAGCLPHNSLYPTLDSIFCQSVSSMKIGNSAYHYITNT